MLHIMALPGIEERIAWAENQFSSCKELCFADSKLSELLRLFRGARTLSQSQMERCGIVEICRRCEMEGGGSCCGAGIEDRYDEWLLLVNLLLGVKLPRQRWKDDSCFFLGPEGCKLVARHAICINYLCKEVIDQVDAEQIARLREKEGEELELLFFICERVKKIVKECGTRKQKGR
ncbi:MAG TPA: hypothetical protein ENF92_06010 [Desulfobacteraceae bacterium]|nr:hypothetical protein [Desulfobacteraceae bacterium]